MVNIYNTTRKKGGIRGNSLGPLRTTSDWVVSKVARDRLDPCCADGAAMGGRRVVSNHPHRKMPCTRCLRSPGKISGVLGAFIVVLGLDALVETGPWCQTGGGEAGGAGMDWI